MGRIPIMTEYMEQAKSLAAWSVDVYRCMNFERIAEFKEVADKVTVQSASGRRSVSTDF